MKMVLFFLLDFKILFYLSCVLVMLSCSRNVSSGGVEVNPNVDNASAEEYTVFFNTNGGSDIQSQSVRQNDTVPTPQAPTRSGQIFVAWYADEQLTNFYNFSTPVTRDIILYARWLPDGTKLHFLSFDSRGGSAITPLTVKSDDLIRKPIDPIRSGYVFEGWYDDNIFFKNPFGFPSSINENVTLYAKWRRVYSIDFHSQGGSSISSQYISPNETATEPEDPTRTGHKFVSWYSDPSLTHLYNFFTPVTQDITLYARWIQESENLYEVHFETNGGLPVTSLTLFGNEKLAESYPKTVRAGYLFIDWYVDPDFSASPYNFETLITQNITLYARWEPYLLVDKPNNTVLGLNPNILSRIGNEGLDLIIPGEFEGVPMTRIADNAFKHNQQIKSLVMEEGVEHIGESAFDSCEEIAGDLVIPNSVLTIGRRAFYRNQSLRGTLTLSNSLIDIADEAFHLSADFVGDVIVPRSVRRIGDSAFGGFIYVNNVIFESEIPPVFGSYFMWKVFFPKIRVPIGSLDLYKEATNFKPFVNYTTGYNIY